MGAEDSFARLEAAQPARAIESVVAHEPDIVPLMLPFNKEIDALLSLNVYRHPSMTEDVVGLGVYGGLEWHAHGITEGRYLLFAARQSLLLLDSA